MTAERRGHPVRGVQPPKELILHVLENRNASRVLQLLNQLEARLRSLVGSENGNPSLEDLISQAAKRDASVRQFSGELHSYRRLRNAIVHNYGRSDQRLMAEPLDSTVERLEQVVEAVCHPRTVRDVMTKNPGLLPKTAGLAEVLKEMSERDFSQVLVDSVDGIILLTQEHIAHWLGSKVEDDLVILSDASLADLCVSPEEDGLACLSCNATAADAADLFAQAISRGLPRIAAIAVTDHGRRSERPLGLITPWDLLEGPR